jgi:hypothetical protein
METSWLFFACDVHCNSSGSKQCMYYMQMPMCADSVHGASKAVLRIDVFGKVLTLLQALRIGNELIHRVEVRADVSTLRCLQHCHHRSNNKGR